MADPTSPTFSTLYANAAHFANPTVDCAALAAAFGHAVATDAADMARQVSSMSQNSPVVLATVLAGDTSAISILHHPVQHPAVPGAATLSDNIHFAIYGNDAAPSVLVRMPENAFRRATAMTVRTDMNQMATALGAAGATGRMPGQATGDADTEDLTVRRTIVLPTAWAARAVELSRLTFLEFYNEFIQPIPAGELANYEYVTQWWRCAATKSSEAGTEAQQNTRLVLSRANVGPGEEARLNTWKQGICRRALLPITVAPAPVLTNAGLQTAFGPLINQIRDQHTATERRELAASNPTFEDRFGQVAMHNLMRVCGLDPATATEDQLPPVHVSLGRNKKQTSRDGDVITQAIDARAAMANCLVTEHTLPVVTPDIIKMFRDHRIAGVMDQVGGGLTPSMLIVVGEPDNEFFRNLATSQAYIESGNVSMSLDDTKKLTINNPKLPVTLTQLLARLAGWTCVMDVYLGPTHAYATRVRAAVTRCSEHLRSLEFARAPQEVMSIGLRVMYYFQCATFVYFGDIMASRTATMPEFDQSLFQALQMAQYNNLPVLPSSWVTEEEVGPARGPDEHRGTGSPSPSGGGREGRVAVTNSHPPQPQLKRFTDSDLTSIGQLTNKAGPDNWKCPEVNGQQICLAWHLKGSCWSTCPRKATHKTASAHVKGQLTKLLDLADVPASA